MNVFTYLKKNVVRIIETGHDEELMVCNRIIEVLNDRSEISSIKSAYYLRLRELERKSSMIKKIVGWGIALIIVGLIIWKLAF